MLQGILFFLGLIAVQRVAGAPFDLYSTFVIDEQFDFNETTPALWARDFVVGLAVAFVLAGALVGVLLALIEFLPTLSWVVGSWLVVVGFMLLSQILYPRVIAPLFNHQHPPIPERMQYIREYAGEQGGSSSSSPDAEAA